MNLVAQNKGDIPTGARRLVITVPGLELSATATPSATLRTYGGVRISGQDFQQTEELDSSTIVRALNSQLGLDPSLASRIAVVQLHANKQCAIYLDPDTATEDEVRGVVAEIASKGWELPAEGAQGYFASYSVVTSIAHGHLDSVSRQTTRDSSESSLYSTFKEYVAWAVAQGADDIDWIVRTKEANSQLAFKIEGRWHQPARFRVPTQTMLSLLGAAWQHSEGGKAATFDPRTAQQGNIEISLAQTNELPEGGRVRLRWSALPNEKGSVVTTRIQRLGQTAKIKTLEDAGYPQWAIDAMRRANQSKGGMVTFAGRVGSGKTTTLAILLSEIPRSMKIQTAEDPVEIDIPGAFQRTIARDLSDAEDEAAFTTTVMGVLRSALDIFYQSEIRDAKSGRLARQVLESGHGVYTTTHARSALGIVNRFTSPEIGIPKEVLGLPDGLKTNIFQAMLSKTCPHCGKSPRDYAADKRLSGGALERHLRYFDLIESLYRIDSEKFRLRDEDGCEECRRNDLPSLNGFAGRTPVCEIVEFTEDMLELVYKGDDYGLIAAWRSLSDGNYESPDLSGKTAMECAIYKASLGMIDPREIEPEFTSFESIKLKRRTA